MSKTLLIAESGSTKTDWRLIRSDGGVQSCSSIGLNPYFIDNKDLTQILEATFTSSEADMVDEVHFYGAGCSNPSITKPFYKAFEQHFVHAKVDINHDLLAAARALFHNEPGLAIILGTGSNSCLYDGSEIIANIPALGYVLGDEGSGADMGKRLIQQFLYNELDSLLTEKLQKQTSKEEILEAVYKRPFPNRYLAAFSSFIGQHIDHPQMRELVKSSFNSFLEKHVLAYPNHQEYTIGIVGSIGTIYQDILHELTDQIGLEIKNIVRSPIEALVDFHHSTH